MQREREREMNKTWKKMQGLLGFELKMSQYVIRLSHHQAAWYNVSTYCENVVTIVR